MEIANVPCREFTFISSTEIDCVTMEVDVIRQGVMVITLKTGGVARSTDIFSYEYRTGVRGSRAKERTREGPREKKSGPRLTFLQLPRA